MSSLAKLLPAGIIALVLCACSQNGPGKALITDRCVAGGESPEICACLADQSAARLDREMFQVIVYGAQGQEKAGERLLRDIGPERQTRFTALAKEIARACGVPDYPVMN